MSLIVKPDRSEVHDRLLGETPEFLRWALARPCPLREYDNWQDPERTDRYLRPLRGYSDAAAAGRIFDGICVEPAAIAGGTLDVDTKGFRAEEVLATYGGLKYVESLCSGCPANTFGLAPGKSLVGCYGLCEWSSLADRLHGDLETIVAGGIGEPAADQLFLATRPRWYGLWSQSPLESAQVDWLQSRLAALIAFEREYSVPFAGLVAALNAAKTHRLPLHVTFVPRGNADRFGWTVASHCPQCKAAQNERERRCAVCARVGRPQPARRRCLRGSRPYWPLADFLGRENVVPFLERYAQFRAGS